MSRSKEVRGALDAIGNVLGPKTEETLCEGLPDGAEPTWGYDEQLVLDLGAACSGWQKRTGNKS